MFNSIKKLPSNVWILALTLSLAMAGIPLLVLVGGLLGARLAPVATLATLPLALNVVGLALATIPAAIIAKKLGRKKAGFIGLASVLLGTSLCAFSTTVSSFFWLLVGATLMGTAGAFLQQFRFAAIESLQDSEDTGPALSVLMLCSIVAGVLGPELGEQGRNLIPAAQPYTGSFLLMALVSVVAMCVFSRFKNPHPIAVEEEADGRSLSTVLKQPVFLVALAASLVGYSIMSFLMTSTPISMNVMDGHSLADSKWVIQSHLVAMFLPSVISGFLIKKYGAGLVMTSGALLYLLVVAIASAGHGVLHYWWALVLLGMGWNFLFISGTTVLPQAYRHSERFKVQAVNDFSIFTTQAIASLIAGWVLFRFGWQIQLLLCMPVIIVMLLIATYYHLSAANITVQQATE